MTIVQALTDLCQFLGQQPVVLVGHNCKRFDVPRLVRAATACGMLEELKNTVSGFVDTLPLFRALNPELSSHRQSILYQHCCGQEYEAHDALADARALGELVRTAGPPHDVMSMHSFSVDEICGKQY